MTNDLTFADYLDNRPPAFTREWRLLQHLKKDSAFRGAASAQDVANYLNDYEVPFGIRRIALAAWQGYAREMRKARS